MNPMSAMEKDRAPRAGSEVIDGVRLRFDDVGPAGAPAVLCLHAIGHDAGDYAGLLARLSGGPAPHRVIALDLPGQGGSGADRQPPTAARYAELAAALLVRLGIESAVLVGNSIGGAAALRLAAAHPTRVRALVLANPGGLDGGPVMRLSCALMSRFFAAGARGARWYPRLFARYYRLVLPSATAADRRDRIIARWREVAPLLADAWRGFGRPEADLRDRAPEIACPILFTWAVRDRFVRLGRSMPAIRRFPNAEVVRFECGHAPQIETPEPFEDAVAAFLARL
jgi:4,5:9,10-diseco-3-hydroxy-5,9,17-trioxoandrosta-1(10),2-diene-4-oate hydrolase